MQIDNNFQLMILSQSDAVKKYVYEILEGKISTFALAQRLCRYKKHGKIDKYVTLLIASRIATLIKDVNNVKEAVPDNNVKQEEK